LLTSKWFLGISLFAVGHAFAWFQLNSQFVWGWWQDKPFLAVTIYSIPVGLCFWYGTNLIVAETGAVWSSRFAGFAASYFVFPILTWALLNESMLTPKTLLCIFLSMCIVLIQIFWR
tara:strand:- start:395 stop:745 length:351 start_codon:yes stop_codon:yes gene_type:complete